MKPRILLLDDEPEIVFVTAEYLSDQGWLPIRCASTAEAEAAITHGPALDAAVLDWVVGGASARGLIEKLRNRHPRCRILLATGFGSDVVDEADLGVPIIRKPFTMRGLSLRLETLLRAPR